MAPAVFVEIILNPAGIRGSIELHIGQGALAPPQGHAFRLPTDASHTQPLSSQSRQCILQLHADSNAAVVIRSGKSSKLRPQIHPELGPLF